MRLRLFEAGAAQEGRPEAFLGAGVAADEDVFQDGHVGEEPDVLEGACDAGFGDQVWFGREYGALVTDGAFGGDVQPGEAVEEGGLSGAVGADEADDFACVDGEVDVAYGGESAESHGDSGGLKDGGAGLGGAFGDGVGGHFGCHAPALAMPAPVSSDCRGSGTSMGSFSWYSSCCRLSATTPSGRKRIRRMSARPKKSSW